MMFASTTCQASPDRTGSAESPYGSRVHTGLRPILFCLYTEPARWPGSGRPIDAEAIAGHRVEIARFSRLVEGDEVTFIACVWQRLLEA